MVRWATNLQRERQRIRHFSGWLVTTSDHNRVTLFPGRVLPVTIMSINVVGDVAGCAEPAARTLIGPSCRTAPGYSVTIELHAGHQPLAIGTQIGLRFPAASLRVLA
jgi:hypothetical protein